MITPEDQAEISEQRRKLSSTLRCSAQGLEEIMYSPHKVLDHGFVRVVDYMGNDASVVQAARVSYGQGTKKMRDDAALIRYLLRNDHSTPFEMCEIKLHVKLPIFVARQWVRHRTANINEYSARYSVLTEDYYLPHPEQIKKQSLENKQGRDGVVDDNIAMHTIGDIDAISSWAHDAYHEILGDRVSREIARMILPVNSYTEWYWKTDLRNLFNFLELRMNPRAQWEIQQYALAISDIVKAWVPVSWKAFRDYRLESKRWTDSQIKFLAKYCTDGEKVSYKDFELTEREWKEVMVALND